MQSAVINWDIVRHSDGWMGSVSKHRQDGVEEVVWEGLSATRQGAEERAVRAYAAYRDDFAGVNAARDW